MADKRVLIVDDEADAIAIAESILSDLDGVTTIAASGGDEGISSAKANQPDMILLDVQMPGKSGFDVFVELRKDEATAGIPVVMVTGIEEKTGIGFSKDEMGDFLGKEPEAYIEKPVDPEELQKTVRGILGL
jgi:CheY-like chemotaxis protein